MLALAASALLLASAPLATDDGPFLDLAFPAALERAKEQDKVVFIDFFTTWCPPCKKLDRTTWKDEQVIAWLGERTVPLKIDAEEQEALAERFGVRSYPTLVFIDPDGAARGSIVGYRNAAGFFEEAADVLAGVSKLDRARERVASAPEDPMFRQELGEELHAAGLHAEALTEYLWCYENGGKTLMYMGVRVTALISLMEELARDHEPARAAMRRLADESIEEVRTALTAGQEEGKRRSARVNGQLHFTCMGAVALYDGLEDLDGLLELHRVIRDDPPTPASLLFVEDQLVDELIDAKRFTDVVEVLDDPSAWLEKAIAFHEQSAAMLRAFEKGSEDRDFDYTAVFCRQMHDVFEAFLALGKVEAARSIADRLIEFEGGAENTVGLAEIAGECRRDDYAEELIEQALARLPESEHGPLVELREKFAQEKPIVSASADGSPIEGATGLPAVDLALEAVAASPESLRSRHALAKELLRAGLHGRAHDELLVCLEFAIRPSASDEVPAFRLVRTLEELARVHEPAASTIRERARSEAAAAIAQLPARGHDPLPYDAVQSLRERVWLAAALLQSIEDTDGLLALHRAVDPASQLAGVNGIFRDQLVELLLEAERFDEALSVLGDPLAWLEEEIDSIEGRREWQRRKNEESDGSFDRTLVGWLRDDVRQVFGALVIEGEVEQARTLADRFLEFEDGVNDVVAFARSAADHGHFELATGLTQDALARLPESEHAPLRQLHEELERRRTERDKSGDQQR